MSVSAGGWLVLRVVVRSGVVMAVGSLGLGCFGWWCGYDILKGKVVKLLHLALARMRV